MVINCILFDVLQFLLPSYPYFTYINVQIKILELHLGCHHPLY